MFPKDEHEFVLRNCAIWFSSRPCRRRSVPKKRKHFSVLTRLVRQTITQSPRRTSRQVTWPMVLAGGPICACARNISGRRGAIVRITSRADGIECEGIRVCCVIRCDLEMAGNERNSNQTDKICIKTSNKRLRRRWKRSRRFICYSTTAITAVWVLAMVTATVREENGEFCVAVALATRTASILT